jgi:hypothetical protein
MSLPNTMCTDDEDDDVGLVSLDDERAWCLFVVIDDILLLIECTLASCCVLYCPSW